MAKKLMSVTVRGRSASWCFDFYGDPQFLAEWRADGLDVIVVENSFPEWVSDCFGYPGVRVWCFVQDLFNFRNPWRT